jgi:hypothetical protein
MTRVVPSQIVDAIDDMFGPARQEIDEQRIGIQGEQRFMFC